MKVSFIIPAYNASSYLSRCLNSIATQKFDGNFEIIVVDDCSTDSTLNIAKEYAGKDERIKIVEHKENKKVSLARKSGFKVAEGEYLWFVDADDALPLNVLADFYSYAKENNSDIVFGDYNAVNDENSIVVKQLPQTVIKDLVIEIFEGKIHGSLCNKLIKRSFFEKQNVVFVPNMNMREDMHVLLQLLVGNPKISYLSEAVYNYFSTQGSLSSSRTLSHIDRQVSSVIEIEKLIDNNLITNEALLRLKLNVRKDIMLYNITNVNLKEIFPETNDQILNAQFIPFWLRLCLLSEIFGFGIIKKILFAIVVK